MGQAFGCGWKISHSGKHAEKVFSGGTCDDNAGKQVTENW